MGNLVIRRRELPPREDVLGASSALSSQAASRRTPQGRSRPCGEGRECLMLRLKLPLTRLSNAAVSTGE